jgi:hypothetical protein
VKRGWPEASLQENPYDAALSSFQPRATYPWFDGIADLGGLPTRPASIRGKDLRWWAFGLIMQFEVPVLRRVLESILVFDYGFDPVAVTNALASLRSEQYIKDTRIYRTRAKFSGEPEPNHVYSYNRRPTVEEMHALRSLYREREDVLDRLLGKPGEHYVRAILKHSDCFADVTQKSKVGDVYDSNHKNRLDLKATGKVSGATFGISVKNMREWLRPDDKALDDVVKRAHAHNALPWLVTSYASGRTIARCAYGGIYLTVLGRQIVNAEDQYARLMRDVIYRLRPVIGVLPFEFCYAQTSRTIKHSETAGQHIKGARQVAANPLY